MAVAFDAVTATASTAGASSKTFSHTCTGTNRLLLVVAGCHTATATISGVTYNGTSMTQVGADQTDSANGRLTLWSLIAPVTGGANVVITASAVDTISYGAISFTGASQSSNPDSNTAGSETATSSYTVTATAPTTNEMAVLVGYAMSGAALTGGANTTIASQPEVTYHGTFIARTTSPQAASGSLPLNVTSSSQTFKGLITTIAPAPIVLDTSVATTAVSGVTSKTFSLNMSGTNRVLFVTTGSQTSDGLVTGVTCTKGGSAVAMTLAGTQTQTTQNVQIKLWYMFGADTGVTNNIVITGSNSMSISYGATSFANVYQSALDSTGVCGTTGSATTSMTANITTVADNAWAFVAMSVNAAGTLTAGTNTTIVSQPEAIANGNAMLRTTAAVTPAGATTLSVTYSSQTGIGVYASFAPDTYIPSIVPDTNAFFMGFAF